MYILIKMSIRDCPKNVHNTIFEMIFRPLFHCFPWTQPGASKQITWSLCEGGPNDNQKDKKKESSIEGETARENKKEINTGKTKSKMTTGG